MAAFARGCFGGRGSFNSAREITRARTLARDALGFERPGDFENVRVGRAQFARAGLQVSAVRELAAGIERGKNHAAISGAARIGRRKIARERAGVSVDGALVGAISFGGGHRTRHALGVGHARAIASIGKANPAFRIFCDGQKFEQG